MRIEDDNPTLGHARGPQARPRASEAFFEELLVATHEFLDADDVCEVFLEQFLVESERRPPVPETIIRQLDQAGERRIECLTKLRQLLSRDQEPVEPKPPRARQAL